MSGMQAARAPGSCSTTSRVSMPAAAVPWRRTTEAAANRPLVPTTGKSTASSRTVRPFTDCMEPLRQGACAVNKVGLSQHDYVLIITFCNIVCVVQT